MGWWDPVIAAAGLLVGVVVGLTGMGGGALMTPVLVFFFGVPPLAAVSSDVVASFFMKPVGGLVHLRQRTVQFGLVRWLCLGSVPGAFCGVLLLRAIGGQGDQVQTVLLIALGTVLVVASLAMAAKSYLKLREREKSRVAGGEATAPAQGALPVRRTATALVGLLGGLVVGMTSVGAGSLIIVCLMLLYPRAHMRQLVGTDLVQAIPLVASASVGHILFGDFTLGLTGSILVGAIPGVFLGARISAHSPGSLVRRALALVMLASGVKLLGAPTGAVLAITLAALVVGATCWAVLRQRHGEAPLVWQERHRAPRGAAAGPVTATRSDP
jgi:uncharacterized membrane protein YfcA